MDLSEIKSLIESQGKAWEQHKATNDELLKAKADGKAVGDLEAKLAKVSDEMDKLSDLKGEIDALIVKSNRPGSGQKADGNDIEAEFKQFGMAAKSFGFGENLAGQTADGYADYKSGLMGYFKHGNPALLAAAEQKAMSTGVDSQGGYLLPSATVGRIVSKIYEQSTLRQLANVVTLSGNELEGLIDNDEANAGWVDEYDSRTETSTPALGKYSIIAHEMYAEPHVTQRILDDAATNVEAWLAGKTADKFARVEGAAFTTGNGSKKPKGLFAYATAATADDTRDWGTFQHIKTGADGAFHTTKADPLMDLIGAFKDQYLQRATWLMRREVRTALRKMKEATSDKYLWEPSMQAGVPDNLLGYPVRIDQYVPAVATGSLSLAFGDFAEAYTIVDRLGIRTIRDNVTTKGRVKFYSTRRIGGGAVNFEAVKFLQFAA
jgi:HK97 family phage major capsid protein